jgi:hypothetical protein
MQLANMKLSNGHTATIDLHHRPFVLVIVDPASTLEIKHECPNVSDLSSNTYILQLHFTKLDMHNIDMHKKCNARKAFFCYLLFLRKASKRQRWIG